LKELILKNLCLSNKYLNFYYKNLFKKKYAVKKKLRRLRTISDELEQRAEKNIFENFYANILYNKEMLCAVILLKNSVWLW